MERDVGSSIEHDLLQAEELLHCGLWDSASAAATRALAGNNTQPAPAVVTRALYVMLQADFQQNRLTPLELVAAEHQQKLHELPVSVLLLWGIIAIELKQLPLARQLLGSYTAANKVTGLSEEDAMALSRLYAVRVLTESCGDVGGATAWLREGGACLTQEQQQLLLAEVEEAKASTRATAAAAAAAASQTEPTHQRAAAAAGTAGPGAFADSQFCTMMGEPCEEGDQTDVLQPGSHARRAGGLSSRHAGRLHGAAGAAGGAGTAAGAGWAGASAAWVQGKAASWWNSPIVQETLQRLHMEELTPLQLAGGTAAAAVMGYAVWRERRTIKQAAANAAVGLTAGVAQTVGMALGFAPNAMNAAPSGQYQR